MTASQPLPLAEIERFGIYEAEETVEKVARAICTEWDSWTDLPVESDESSRRLAAAAIAAMPTSRAEEALRRVEAVVETFRDEAETEFWHGNPELGDLYWRIRAAIAAPQTGEHATEETTGAMPADWLTAFNADGIPNWAALQAWNEADDDVTVMAIKARAAALAEQHPTDEEADRG